jgi:hypothetical protein
MLLVSLEEAKVPVAIRIGRLSIAPSEAILPLTCVNIARGEHHRAKALILASDMVSLVRGPRLKDELTPAMAQSLFIHVTLI